MVSSTSKVIDLPERVFTMICMLYDKVVEYTRVSVRQGPCAPCPLLACAFKNTALDEPYKPALRTTRRKQHHIAEPAQKR